MRPFHLLLILLFCGFAANAQDTLLTNYPNTQQRWEKIFLAGEKVAENIYHANGTPWMTVRYNEERDEQWKWFHANGEPFFAATIIDDQLQGTYRIWYENGQLAEKLNFVDNLEDGPATFYHPNGQLAMEGQYATGKMVGNWQFFAEDGTPAEGAWAWQFAALPEFTRLSGSLKSGMPVGTWTYRTTATPRNGRQIMLEWNRSK
ncbi:toxin-antitoxin system YwqK family antitoxin [Lewinella sp. W8]|uniref:toxin-antitoxin system YwqK family antitoxin n=1 Tax=Lewinella sp. W8 TaxID=2528208 RepID=UPI001068D258|nr:hypothetical protein [Lewinella sp. W8]MTB53520.1 hypothetical protein [Lewinella sp. W8]